MKRPSREYVQPNWIDEFRRLSAPRLRALFDNDFETLPKSVIDKLEELRKAERAMQKRKLNKITPR